LLYQFGTSLANGFSASTWVAAQPAITLIIAIYTSRESASKLKILGIMLVCTGVFSQSYLTWSTFDTDDNVLNKTSGGFLLGQICFLGYTIIFSYFGFQSKYMSQSLSFPALSITFWSYMGSWPFACLAWGSDIALHEKPYTFEISIYVFAGLAISVFLGTFVAYTMYNYGNKYVEPSFAMAIGGVAPISARMFSSLVVRTTKYPHWGLHDWCLPDLTLVLVVLGLWFMYQDGRRRLEDDLSTKEEKIPLLSGVSLDDGLVAG